jgi:hypothetical protein
VKSVVGFFHEGCCTILVVVGGVGVGVRGISGQLTGSGGNWGGGQRFG